MTQPPEAFQNQRPFAISAFGRTRNVRFVAALGGKRTLAAVSAANGIAPPEVDDPGSRHAGIRLDAELRISDIGPHLGHVIQGQLSGQTGLLVSRPLPQAATSTP